MQLEAEREKRIQHTQDMAMRRLANKELSMGWTTLRDLFLDHKRELRLLARLEGDPAHSIPRSVLHHVRHGCLARTASHTTRDGARARASRR